MEDGALSPSLQRVVNRLAEVLGDPDLAREADEERLVNLFRIWEGLWELFRDEAAVRDALRARCESLDSRVPIELLRTGEMDLVVGWVDWLCGRT